MKRMMKVWLLVALVVTMLPLGALAALGAPTESGVEPVVVPGNPKICDGFKIEDPVSGNYTKKVDGVDVTVKLTVYMTDMGEMLDFEVLTAGYKAYTVVAKGGKEGANIYYYTPDGVVSDKGLHCPVNPSGKYADFSHVDFCFGPGNGGGQGALSGTKWYDRNENRMWDEGEPGIEGWKIILSKLVDGEYEPFATTYTNASGGYSFANLEPGTYKVEEGPVSGDWVQTYPVSPNYYAGINIVPNLSVSDLDFGNVCKRFTVNGKTIGFWTNKNGQAVLNANPGWMMVLKDLNLTDGTNAFDPTSYAQLRTFLNNANSTNMSYMLSAQMAATVLNCKYMNENCTTMGVVIDGKWVSIEDVIKDANALLATYNESTDRAKAEMYKDIFDGLNNNQLKVIPYNPCAVPVWVE